MDRERLSLLTRRTLGSLAAGALSAEALARIESVERRLAGAETDEGPSAVRRGRHQRRKKRFLVLGEASGDIFDLLAKRHRVTVGDGAGTASVSGFDGVIVDHDHHDAESLAGLEPMLDAYHTDGGCIVTGWHAPWPSRRT